MQDKDTFCQVESQGQFYYWDKVIDIKTSKKTLQKYWGLIDFYFTNYKKNVDWGTV